MTKYNRFLFDIENDNGFSIVNKTIKDYKDKNVNVDIVSLGIGDVSIPIIKGVADAMHKAVDDLTSIETFKGYGFYYGYDFLKEKILENEYKNFGLSLDEIYISSGTKSDSTNILELFEKNSSILVTSAMYPVYKDGAAALSMKVDYLDVDESSDFKGSIPNQRYDIIYICSPSNPIGVAYTYEELEKWIQYANDNESIIIFDNVYESFITSENVPKSIYEIQGAKKCAIELRSFSKKASFTGVRCSYYVIPNEIDKDINILWKKRTINRYNGCDYIAQCGAAALYDSVNMKESKMNIKKYSDNALYLRKSLLDLGFIVYGGIDCPFMWVKTKDNMDCWEFFDLFLYKLNIIIIPGSVFGNSGKYYFRVSALGNREDIEKAVERIRKYYEK